MNLNLILIAFWGGILSTFTPCNIIALPTYATQILKDGKNIKITLMLSIFYGLGFTVIFTLIGIALLFVPGFIKNQVWLQIFGGGVISCMGLYLLLKELMQFKTNKNFNHYPEDSQNKEEKVEDSETIESNLFRFFLTGVSFGTSGFSCVLPIFLPVLSMIIMEGTVLTSIPYLFLYSLGIFIPYIPLGLGLSKINDLFYVKMIKYQRWINILFSIIISTLGIIYLIKGLRILL